MRFGLFKLLMQCSSSTARRTMVACKSPNVVLIDVASNLVDSEGIARALFQALDPQRYCVVVVSMKKFLELPWKGNCACVVIPNSLLVPRKIWDAVYDYFRNNGSVIVFCPPSSRESFTNDCGFFITNPLNPFVNSYDDRFCMRKIDDLRTLYTLEDRPARAIFMYTQFDVDEQRAIGYFRSALSDLDFYLRDLCYKTPRVVGGRLYAPARMKLEVLAVEQFKSGDLTIAFGESFEELASPIPSYIPIVVDTDGRVSSGRFDPVLYFQTLQNRRLGTLALHIPVVETTMTILQGCPMKKLIERAVVIADFQLDGSGRSGNKWISADGSVAFTFHILRSRESLVTARCSWLQHLVAMAVVVGIRSIPGYEETPLKIKWPNDIFVVDGTKVGGVLVTGCFGNDSMEFSLGCGLNLNNQTPTMAINQVVPMGMPKLETGQVIAVIMNHVERFLEMLEEDRMDELCQIYKNNWIHDQQIVVLQTNSELVRVESLDEHGYLKVRSLKSDELWSVEPDGNSFDMMRNLIVSKR